MYKSTSDLLQMLFLDPDLELGATVKKGDTEMYYQIWTCFKHWAVL